MANTELTAEPGQIVSAADNRYPVQFRATFPIQVQFTMGEQLGEQPESKLRIVRQRIWLQVSCPVSPQDIPSVKAAKAVAILNQWKEKRASGEVIELIHRA